MVFDIISLIPKFWYSIIKYNPIINRALKKNIIKINIINLKKFGIKKGKKIYIDDYQYGGGYGMVLKIEPIYKCIKYLKKKYKYDHIIYLTPDAKLYKQKNTYKFLCKKRILFICGHFKGIDQRIRDYIVTNEYSIGKYILSNGEISTLVFLDSIIRLIPGVIGNIKSTITDSFNNNIYYYEHPLYTRPYNFKNMIVPKILLSGNHNMIKRWRLKKILIKKKKLLKKKGTK
ncbi:MAG: tRNA (guanosine(37)-N1)-methyltransferase TrmD [Candidatus Shikimatogenerans bostrichidophilus]|nr:MAG: tRNA (guanosine(37)-N1)-methyltransferase TrmD [Candidatus Shikimatogenerans bostrichidophilus]